MEQGTKTIQEMLEHYIEIQQYITNVHADIADCQSLITQEAAPKSPCLSGVGGGGGEKCSPEEKAIFRRERLLDRIDEYRNDLIVIEPYFNRLKRALTSMKSFDFLSYRIVKAKYVQGKTWDATSYLTGLPNSSCRDMAAKALYSLATMVFWKNEIPEQMSLQFLNH